MDRIAKHICRITFIFALLISNLTYAENISYLDFAQKPVQRIEFESIKGIRVTTKCGKKCLALSAIKKAVVPKPEGNLSGLASAPSSVLCKSLDGHLVLLYDEQSNQHPFCRFQDNSMFSSDDWLSLN